MSHDPTSMNRAELQAYVAELLAAHDMHVGIVADLRSDLAAAKEREAALVGALKRITVWIDESGDAEPSAGLEELIEAKLVLDTHAPGWRDAT